MMQSLCVDRGVGESYIGIRQCPHLREIPENCPKMARDRFLIIVPDLIYIIYTPRGVYYPLIYHEVHDCKDRIIMP